MLSIRADEALVLTPIKLTVLKEELAAETDAENRLEPLV
jgi:hypothetical protein